MKNPFKPRLLQAPLSFSNILDRFELTETREKEVNFVQLMLGKSEAGKVAFNSLLSSIGLDEIESYEPILEDTGLIDFAARKNYNKRVDLVVKDEAGMRLFIVEMAALSSFGKWDDVHQEQIIFKHFVATTLYKDFEVFTIALSFNEFDSKHRSFISEADNMFATHLTFFEDNTYQFTTHDIQKKIETNKQSTNKNHADAEVWLKISAEEWGWSNRVGGVDKYGITCIGKSSKGSNKGNGLLWIFKKGNAKISYGRAESEQLFSDKDIDSIINNISTELGVEVLTNAGNSDWVNFYIPFDTNDYSEQNKDLLKRFTTEFAKQTEGIHLLEN
jgi:hypothetical protein